jgi:adenylosuccinate lyase
MQSYWRDRGHRLAAPGAAKDALTMTGRGTTLSSVIPRYSRPAMAKVWSEETKLARWLDVELAALDGWAEVGTVPAEAVREIRQRATPPAPERVAELERETQHDVAAFVDAVASELGPAGRWFHYGLTSSDVVDTGLSLQVRDAGALLLEELQRSFEALVARAEEHRETLIMGRTHGVHAEPTTFGLKLVGWAFELDRGRARLLRALEGIRFGNISGAVGNYAAVDPEVERVACERLGLEPAPASTQILQRDRHAELLSTLALVASSLDKFALEIRLLARTEVAEVAEPFRRRQKGSSAMPHKRNPIAAERICGLARVVRAAAQVGLENVALWHERDISHSSAERVVIPDAFLALDFMLDRFTWLMEGLVVRAERMRRNLEASHGLFFSQRLLLALVDSGLGRDEAYRLVQAAAMRAWEEERDFRDLVRADEEVGGRVDLDAVFDLSAYTRHVDTVFERLHALRKEPAHV